MMPYKYFEHCKSILCLNGSLPKKHFFETDKLIIAADGGANQLQNIGVIPSVILGDLDSIKEANFGHSKIVHLPDQNQTDFEKSLAYLADNNLLPTIICGANGGYIDHILQNINVILENDCVFYDPPLIGLILKEGNSIELNLELNTKISLFGFKAQVKTQGLKWNLSNEYLDFPGKTSCLNRVINDPVSIEVTKGKVLILVYETSQLDAGLI